LNAAGASASGTKPGRHDADDLIRLAVQLDRRSHRRRLAREEARPKTVRDDDDVLVSRLVVVALDRSTRLRRHAEHMEPVARDALTRHTLGVAARARQIRAEIRLDGDRLEAARLVAIVTEAGGRNGRFHAVERRIEVLDRHEHPGVAVGQGPQQNRIYDAEDGRVRADAERQRDEHDGREDRTLSESPEAVGDVAKQSVHRYLWGRVKNTDTPETPRAGGRRLGSTSRRVRWFAGKA
jgi:hypothetical protein